MSVQYKIYILIVTFLLGCALGLLPLKLIEAVPTSVDGGLKNTFGLMSEQEEYSQGCDQYETQDVLEIRAENKIISDKIKALSELQEASLLERLSSDFISGLSVDSLKFLLSAFSPLSPSMLKSAQNPVYSWTRFTKILTSNVYRDEFLAAQQTYGLVSFSENEFLNQSQSVSRSNEGKTFARFALSESRNSVFVKWYHADTQKLLAFRAFSTDSNQAEQDIWHQKDLSMPLGQYIVEVYTNDGKFDLIAAGAYYVSN